MTGWKKKTKLLRKLYFQIVCSYKHPIQCSDQIKNYCLKNHLIFWHPVSSCDGCVSAYSACVYFECYKKKKRKMCKHYLTNDRFVETLWKPIPSACHCSTLAHPHPALWPLDRFHQTLSDKLPPPSRLAAFWGVTYPPLALVAKGGREEEWFG